MSQSGKHTENRDRSRSKPNKTLQRDTNPPQKRRYIYINEQDRGYSSALDH